MIYIDNKRVYRWQKYVLFGFKKKICIRNKVRFVDKIFKSYGKSYD